MYQPADMSLWHGRDDTPGEGAGGRRWHQCVQALSMPADACSQSPSPHNRPQTRGTALLGFACDAGVARNHGRVGAKAGPQALRRMLANLPAPPSGGALFDAGDIVCAPPQDGAEEDDVEDSALEAAQAQQAQVLASLLHRGLLPLTLGGGHEVALGSFRGLAQYLSEKQQQTRREPPTAAQSAAHAPARIGIVNFDAHFDLRLAPRGSSGTPFRQIAEDCQTHGWPFHYCCLGVSRHANTPALFERARQLGVCWVEDSTMARQPHAATLRTLQDFIAQVEHVYFTLCLDVLPASTAPGVSAPAALGVDLALVELLLEAVAQSGKLRLADIAELNPAFDIDQRTARTAARLVARLVETFRPAP